MENKDRPNQSSGMRFFLKKKQKKMDNKSATGDENNNQALKTNIQLQIMMSTHLN